MTCITFIIGKSGLNMFPRLPGDTPNPEKPTSQDVTLVSEARPMLCNEVETPRLEWNLTNQSAGSRPTVELRLARATTSHHACPSSSSIPQLVVSYDYKIHRPADIRSPQTSSSVSRLDRAPQTDDTAKSSTDYDRQATSELRAARATHPTLWRKTASGSSASPNG